MLTTAKSLVPIGRLPPTSGSVAEVRTEAARIRPGLAVVAPVVVEPVGLIPPIPPEPPLPTPVPVPVPPLPVPVPVVVVPETGLVVLPVVPAVLPGPKVIPPVPP